MNEVVWQVMLALFWAMCATLGGVLLVALAWEMLRSMLEAGE